MKMVTELLDAIVGLIDLDLFMSTGPLVALLLVISLLLREVVLLLYGQRAATTALAVIIAPLLLLFTVQIGLVLAGY